MRSAVLRRNIKITPMKTNMSEHSVSSASVAHTSRYQIYRQARAGNYMLEVKTDSPTEAVAMFAIMSPAYDGGDIRLWDAREQRIAASVNWTREKTDFGFAVPQRTNVFHDRMLAILARQLSEKEALRIEVKNELTLGVAV